MGRQTLYLKNKPYINGAYGIVGKKEGQGPLKHWFDCRLTDDSLGEKTWEKSESKLLTFAIIESIKNAGIRLEEVGTVISGDLLNQIMSSSYMARDLHLPFLGIYGACSTMAESMVLGGILVDGKYRDNVVVGASSHYCTAERQFRMPLEHGNQRPPYSQWTVTGAGATVISSKHTNDNRDEEKMAIRMECCTIGKVIDPGIKDVNNMGSAMAPAAVDTLLSHLEDTGRKIEYYDAIYTGDLGSIGKKIATSFLLDYGINEDYLKENYHDCGEMIYYKSQDVHGGGSGCGCSASIIASYIYKKMRAGEMKRVLLMSTGALVSTISPFQGESIPSIAHAVVLETEGQVVG